MSIATWVIPARNSGVWALIQSTTVATSGPLTWANRPWCARDERPSRCRIGPPRFGCRWPDRSLIFFAASGLIDPQDSDRGQLLRQDRVGHCHHRPVAGGAVGGGHFGDRAPPVQHRRSHLSFPAGGEPGPWWDLRDRLGELLPIAGAVAAQPFLCASQQVLRSPGRFLHPSCEAPPSPWIERRRPHIAGTGRPTPGAVKSRTSRVPSALTPTRSTSTGSSEWIGAGAVSSGILSVTELGLAPL
jgi:hypothetical protein